MDQGTCRHSADKNLNRCQSYDVSSINDCRAACTSYEPCLGYIYMTGDSPLCELIPSSNACPSNYELLKNFYTKLAKTANAIIQGGAKDNSQCYVKM